MIHTNDTKFRKIKWRNTQDIQILNFTIPILPFIQSLKNPMMAIQLRNIFRYFTSGQCTYPYLLYSIILWDSQTKSIEYEELCLKANIMFQL